MSADDQIPEAEQDKYSLLAAGLLKESDRGCVILAASLLGEALEELLRAFFRQAPQDAKRCASLFEGYAPLSTFAARLEVAYALALLPRTLHAKIEVVRRLRNECAHELAPLDFDDPRFRDRLALLKGPDLKPDPPEPSDQEETPDPNREIMVRRIAFALRVVKIVGHLDALASRAREGLDIRQIVLKAEEERAAQQADAADEAQGGTRTAS